MDIIIKKIQSTKDDKTLGIIRIFIAIIIGSTGIMKITVPMLGNAWSGQLIQANIPLYSFNVSVIPIVEIAVGVMLAAGFLSRLFSLVVIFIMIVATYVHLVVNDPSLFPLQPNEPVIPLVLMFMAFYILVSGGGAWSLDSKASQYSDRQQRQFGLGKMRSFEKN